MTIVHVYKETAIWTEYSIIMQYKTASHKIKKQANDKISFVEFILDSWSNV